MCAVHAMDVYTTGKVDDMCAVHAMDVYTIGKVDVAALKSYTIHFMTACLKERDIYTHRGS